MTVRDAAGNATTVGPWTIRQEHTPPELTVSGPLKPIRPSVTGVSSMLQLRGPLAPEEFSWHVDLQPELELKELPDGGVAVVLATEPGTDIAGMVDPPAPPSAAEQRAALPDTATSVSGRERAGAHPGRSGR